MGFFGNLFGSDNKEEKLSRIKLLIGLAAIDDDGISAVERKFIFSNAAKMGLDKNDLAQAIQNIKEELRGKEGEYTLPTSKEERFDIVHDLVLLMLIDGNIDPKETEFCHKVAEKLGFDSSIVTDLVTQYITDEDFKQKIKRLNEIANEE
ncbi:MAG: TerB family tellurite resistance protein [Neisseriaceae bacterium]|nr:TerB family tellurite resistance protein [Neisseriaceae bacterium]